MAGGYTTLNNVAVKNLASTILFENIVQNIMILPGRSAEFKYAQDVDAASIAIQRTKLYTDGRQLGQATNGLYYDNAYGSVQSQIFNLELDIVASRPAKIAAVADTMNGAMLLKSQLQNIPKMIARVVNASYFASLLTAVLQPSVGITVTSANDVVSYAANTKYVTTMSANTAAAALTAYNSAASNLGDGDTANGFDIFELKNSVLYGRAAYLMALRNNLGGLFAASNLAQEMVASGSFTAFDTEYRPNMIDGYMGELNGSYVYIIGSLFTLAEGWLGLKTVATGAIAADDAITDSLAPLNAILVCGDAVGGALDLRSEVKVIDSVGGQGWEIQPLARCGWTVFSPKGIQLIAGAAGLDYSDFCAATGAAAVVTITKTLALLPPLNRA